MERVDKKTYSDLVVILGMMSLDMRARINPKFVKAIVNNASKEYKSDIKPYIPLREQQLSKQTEAFLALIYKGYFENEKSDEEIVQGLSGVLEDEKEIQNENKEIIKTKETKENQILHISKEKKISSIFRKIKLCIKNILRRKNRNS